MRLYTDPRRKVQPKPSTRPTSLPSSSESGGGRALKTQSSSPTNDSAALSGKRSYSRKSGNSVWQRQHQVAEDIDHDSDASQPTPEEMDLLIQLRRAKLDMARAESEYLATLLESERGKAKHTFSRKHNPLTAVKQIKSLQIDQTVENASEGYSSETDQFCGYNSTEKNPFMVDGVLIDSDDEFLGNAFQKRQPALTPLYVDPDGPKSKMGKIKTRLRRLFGNSD